MIIIHLDLFLAGQTPAPETEAINQSTFMQFRWEF